MNINNFLTVPEVAERLGCKDRRVRNLIVDDCPKCSGEGCEECFLTGRRLAANKFGKSWAVFEASLDKPWNVERGAGRDSAFYAGGVAEPTLEMDFDDATWSLRIWIPVEGVMLRVPSVRGDKFDFVEYPEVYSCRTRYPSGSMSFVFHTDMAEFNVFSADQYGLAGVEFINAIAGLAVQS